MSMSPNGFVCAIFLPIYDLYNIFRQISDRCGGFVGLDRDTQARTHLKWAWILVRATFQEILKVLRIQEDSTIFKVPVAIDEDLYGNGYGGIDVRSSRVQMSNILISWFRCLNLNGNNQDLLRSEWLRSTFIKCKQMRLYSVVGMFLYMHVCLCVLVLNYNHVFACPWPES